MRSVRLFTCISLSLEIELEVNSGKIPLMLEGYTSHDQMVGPVKRLLHDHALPWNETFVSMFVLLPHDSTNTLHNAFGYPFELDIEKVLADIALVCSDDIQNWVRSGVAPRVALNLQNLDAAAKAQALRNARLQSNSARAEARMFRPLRVEDIHTCSGGS
jgi:hypothetical protein